LERVVTSDGYGPLLFYLVLGLAVVLLTFPLHFRVAFGARPIAW
jgi:hypothetical protein